MPRFTPFRTFALHLALAVMLVPLLAPGFQAHASGPVVTLFAAASTTGAVNELAEKYKAETGVEVRVNTASSSTLARQIHDGAGADLYLSANELWMDWLEQRGDVLAASRIDLLANRLVLAAPAGKAMDVRMDSSFALASSFSGRLAVGDPDHVPAGIYAKQALTSLGWWDGVKDRLVPASNVRQALRFIETGEVALGVVYASDAATSGKVETVAVFPAWTHDPIHYPLALTPGATPEARAFYTWLQGSEAASVFQGWKFGVLSGSGEEE